MTISVLMCTYNGSRYIHEQIESIFNQSLQPDEMIIIDDCSSDDTVQIINKFIQDNNLSSSWTVKQNRTNKGWRLNFREGISEITGDILFFADQDDIWDQDKIKNMMDIFLLNPQINVLSSIESLMKDCRIKVTEVENGMLENVVLNSSGDNFQIRCPGCAMALRTDYLRKLSKYYSMEWAHDDFCWKFSALDKTGFFWHKSTIIRRIHGENASVVKHRNRSERISLLERDNRKFETLNRYCKDLRSNQSEPEEIERLDRIDLYIAKYMEGNRTRIEYLDTKKLVLWFRLLIKYRMIYHSPKALFGDLLI